MVFKSQVPAIVVHGTTFPLPPNLEEGSQPYRNKIRNGKYKQTRQRGSLRGTVGHDSSDTWALPIDSDRLAGTDALAHANYYSKAYRSNQTSGDIGGAVATMAGNTEAQTNTTVGDLNPLYLNLLLRQATADTLFRSQFPKFP
jgi:hypothetical protein